MPQVSLDAILGAEGGVAPVAKPRKGEALAAYLAAEELGSPYEAAQLGRPVNGPAGGADGGEAIEDPGAYPKDLDELHSKLVDWFEQAERSSTEARQLSERDRDYKDGLQLDGPTLEALKKRGQPPLVDNFVRDKVELLCGMQRKARTDPKAFPRTPNEDDRAQAATAALRYIADDTGMPTITSEVFENMLVEGYGGAELGIEDDGKGGANITITHVGWERLWHDPHSRAKDFNDARYLGLVLWMDRDQLEDIYPDTEDGVDDAFSCSDGSYSDRPGDVSWQDSKRQRVRVVQVHWSEAGDWWSATISRAGFLAEPAKSPFLDRKGRSACPLILQAAYINRDNQRYGVVRDLISGQDAINKRQSKALHLLSVNQLHIEAGAVDDVDHARRQAALPDGVIVSNPGLKMEIHNGAELVQGQFRLLEISMQRMQAKGPNAAMSGTDPRDQSGRAILAQQQGGAAAHEPLADALRQWTRRVFESAWMAARSFWREEKFIRITDDMDEVKWLSLNRKVTLQDELKAMPPEQMAMTMQQMQMVPGDPRLQQVIRVENELHDLDVDIQIEEGQDVPAQAAEDFQALVQLAGSQPGIIPPDVLIAASSLKNKADLLERMKKAEEGQGQSQMEQGAIAKADAEAGVAVKKTQAMLNEAKANEIQQGQAALNAVNEARANDLRQSAVAKIASVHKQAAESYAIPDVGPMDHPQQLPTPPAQQGPPQ